MALSNKKLLVMAETVVNNVRLATYSASIDLLNEKMTVSYNYNGNADNATVIADQNSFDEFALSIWNQQFPDSSTT